MYTQKGSIEISVLSWTGKEAKVNTSLLSVGLHD
jgi:hypothetical protein